MTLPKDTIQTPIGELKIIEVDGIIDGDSKCLGIFNYGKNFNIAIRKDLHKDIYKQTMLHEIFHALEFNAGYDLKEHQIDSLATQMLYFIRNNPKWVKWLQERGRKCIN